MLLRRGTTVLTGDRDGSLRDRLKLVSIGLKLLVMQPVVGIGPGTVRKRIEQSGIHLNQGAANHVEVAFLQAWLDAGLLGGIGFLALWLWLLLRPSSSELRGDDQIRWGCAKGMTVALVVYLFFNVIFDNLAFWVIVGLVAAHSSLWHAPLPAPSMEGVLEGHLRVPRALLRGL